MTNSPAHQVRGVVADGLGTLRVQEFSIAAPKGREVLVRIQASGICHTDLDHAINQPPLILGHEGAGIVAAVGEQATACAVGDRVLLNWAIPCGVCFQCKRGARNLCEEKPTVPVDRFHHADMPVRPMFGLGTLAEMSLVPEQAIIKIPDGIPFPIAAIMGCGVMTGYGSVVNVAEVQRGESVVILGCGGVGLSVLLAAVMCGAAPIIAIDVNEAKLDKASQLGASTTLLASRADQYLTEAAACVRTLTGGRGADYAFECTAVPELGIAPLAMVRNGGTAVAVSGIEQTIQANMELFEFDKWYINPLYGACDPARDFPRLIDLYQSGRLPLDSLLAESYTLDTVPAAFEALRRGDRGKGVLLFNDIP
jgi:S-(hydroxymethyl)glutathione dehydrogenase/alcohol dehydrogenase